MRCFCSHLNQCFLGLGFLLISGCISWADDIEIDLNAGSTPTLNGTSSEKDSSISKNLTNEITPTITMEKKPGVIGTMSSNERKKTKLSNIRSLNFSGGGSSAIVSIEGDDLPRPFVQNISKNKILLKFSKTRLNIPTKIMSGISLLKDVRSSTHAGTAWLVLDVNNVQKTALEKSDVGFSLLLNPGQNNHPENESEPSPVVDSEDSKEKGMFSRLVDSN